MNKKIIVSGCSNCPYLTVWNDGEGNGVDSVTSGSCGHQSFNKELLTPKISATLLFQYDHEYITGERAEDSKVYAVKPGTTPDWCPLPNDYDK